MGLKTQKFLKVPIPAEPSESPVWGKIRQLTRF